VRRAKYGNKRVKFQGVTFDSIAERDRFIALSQLQREGHISNLERQVKIPLQGKRGPILTPTGRQAYYVADFTYVDWREDGVKIIEDKKGMQTPEFKLKRAILAAQGIEIRVT
jgi:hypothetical protein